MIAAAELTKLLEKVQTAAKRAEDGDAAEQGRAVDGLRALHKAAVSTGVLAETQAGKRVRALSKHPRPEVAKAAAEVVATWKEVVRRESEGGPSSSAPTSRATFAGGGGGGSAAAGASLPVQRQSSVGLPSGQQTATGPASSSQPQEEPQAAAAAAPPTRREMPQIDAKAVPSAGEPIRDKCRLSLAQALALALGEGAAGEPVVVAVAVESAVFVQNGGVNAAYKAKFRNLHFNLKDEKNPDLRRKVLTEEVAPATLVTLPPEELASDAKREENARIREKKLFDSAPSSAKQATTDQFQCGKCKQRKCTYYQMQTRSADEPMTTFVTCMNCNNRWKFC